MRAPTSTSSTARTSRRTVAGLAGLVAVAAAITAAGASTAYAQVPRVAKFGPMLFVGDSVGASIQGNLQPLLTAGGYTYRYDAKSGRCTVAGPKTTWCAGNDGLGVITALPTSFKPTYAVVELGYNDIPSTLGPAMDKVMQALLAKGVVKVFWINLAERRPDPRGGVVYDDYNAVLRAGAKRWPQITLLDWNAASSGAAKTNWFIAAKNGKPDLIHLTAVGRPKFAEWIRDELDRLKTAGALPGTTPANPPPTTTGARPEIRQGATGQYVVDLQTELVRRGAKIAKDGRFGPATDAAVKAFQRTAGLRTDGIVGPKTWKALGF